MSMIRLVKGMWTKMLNFYRIKKYSINIQNNVVLNGECFFISDKRGAIEIQEYTRINSGKKYNQIGGDVRTIIRTIENGTIRIGKNVGISNSALVARESIIVEDDVRIGGSCKIYDNDFHSIDYDNRMKNPDTEVLVKPVVIRNGAFIGAHTIVLKGVTIGVNSVVGAGSVVTKDIPDNEIWAGNPARYIKNV